MKYLLSIALLAALAGCLEVPPCKREVTEHTTMLMWISSTNQMQLPVTRTTCVER